MPNAARLTPHALHRMPDAARRFKNKFYIRSQI
jgi:hypothetical protein